MDINPNTRPGRANQGPHAHSGTARRWRAGRSTVRTLTEALEPRLHLAAQLVTDTTISGTVGELPQLVRLNASTALFVVDDAVHGRELWKTDGTTAGTVLVRDIVPGAAGSGIGQIAPAQSGTHAWFVVADGTSQSQLWKTDGTSGGTVLVRDFATAGYGPVQQLTVAATPAGETAFFTLSDGVNGNELWMSDGTTAGTAMLKDINPGAGGSNIRELNPVSGGVMFSAVLPATGAEPWSSDGTAGNTLPLGDLVTGVVGSAPTEFTALGSAVCFTATNSNSVRTLYRCNALGAAPTVLAAFTNLTPANLTVVGGSTLYFSLTSSTSTNQELWKSDGTAGGTTSVAVVGNLNALPIDEFTDAGGTLYFVCADTAHGSELWKSDGTASGTGMVLDIETGPSGSTPSGLTYFNGKVYFSAFTTTSGAELWTSDGTPAGTALLKDIGAYSDGNPTGLTVLNDELVFVAQDAGAGAGIWSSDGTTPGTVFRADPDPRTGDANAVVLGFTPSNAVYFTTTDAALGTRTIWKSDGTSAGTFSVFTDADRFDYGFSAAVVGEGLFFRATTPANGYEPWYTNGAPGNASLVKDIATTTASSFPTGFRSLNGLAYFFAASALYQSDGASAGTTLVSATSGSGLITFNGALYFTRSDGLYRSDGTEAGTAKVNSGTIAITGELVPAADAIYFAAGDLLYKTDGTQAGTLLVKDLNPAAPSTNVTYARSIVPFGAAGIAFVSYDPPTDAQFLWVSNGTPAGTVQVMNLGAPYDLAWEPLDVVGDRIYFVATTPANGAEMWISDGTPAGTSLLLDVRPGPLSSNISGIHGGPGGRAYFIANDGTHGDELWSTDGIPAGTALVQEINPGPAGIRPGYSGVNTVGFAIAPDDRLFFVADDGTHGRELWVLVPEPVPFAYIDAGVLYVNGTDGDDALSLRYDPGEVIAGLNGATLSFPTTAFSTVRINGGAGNDVLSVSESGSPPAPMRFAGGAGDDTLVAAHGAIVLGEDLSAGGDLLTVSVVQGASLTFNASQHLAGLMLEGAAILAPGSQRFLVTGSLALSPGATLDLHDNDLLLDYSGASPYTAVRNWIALARNDRAWNMPGITSSAARNAPDDNTTLGVMESADYLDIHGAGATFNGEPLDDSMVLVKYTYYGDTDFSGQIDFDDFAWTDFGFNTLQTAWRFGDFDGNGLIDFDDYALIDLGFNTQGAAL